MGFAGLNTAISGLRAAQVGLGVTGHNMSNSEIKGYSRQRAVQYDSFYQKIGVGANGNALRRGSGTDWNAISQIRNEFLDFSYRQANSKLSFYAVKTTVGAEIEANLGELQGSDNFQSVVQDMWYSIEELTAHPQGIETREYFLATCGSFVTKANEVYDSLFKYQINLDQQVRGAVEDVNNTVTRIKELNDLIRNNEVSGDNANDYRDARNLELDRLSELIPISYSYDNHGNATIFSEGHSILVNNSQNFFGLRYTSSEYGFVEPVLTGVKKDEILAADTPPNEFEQYINYGIPVNADRNNDYGILKGLIVARGAVPAYYLGKEGLPRPQGMPKHINTVKDPDTSDQAVMDLLTEIAEINITDTTHPDYVERTDAERYFAIEETIKDFLLKNESDPGNLFENDTVNINPNDFAALDVPVDPNDPDSPMKTPTLYERFVTAQKSLMRQHQAEAYNYEQQAWSVDNAMITRTMIKLDQVFHSIVTLINDAVAPAAGTAADPDNIITPNLNDTYVGAQEPFNYDKTQYEKNKNAPYDNQGNQSYTEVFVRSAGPGTDIDRFDEDGYLNPEFKGDYYSQYSIGNVVMNPALVSEDGGYNLLALSKGDGIEDTRLLNELQQLWKSNTSEYAVEVSGISFNMDESYNKFVTQIATEVSEARNYVENQTVQVERAETKRQTIMGVSMDEELNNMMKYQYAYQAAARIVNVIDSMIDRIINGTGRVGL